MSASTRRMSLGAKLVAGVVALTVLGGLVGAFAIWRWTRAAGRGALAEAETLAIAIARAVNELHGAPGAIPEFVQELHATQRRDLVVVDVHRVFERFTQADTETARCCGGHWARAHHLEAPGGELRGAAAAGDPFRLALLDRALPGMDGEALATAIKAEPDLADGVLVLVSSLGDPPDRARLSTAGFSAAVTKPVHAARLLDAVSAAWGLTRWASRLAGSLAGAMPCRRARLWRPRLLACGRWWSRTTR